MEGHYFGSNNCVTETIPSGANRIGTQSLFPKALFKLKNVLSMSSLKSTSPSLPLLPLITGSSRD